MKINSDAAFDKATGVGYRGLVCRDEYVRVLTTMAHRIFANSPLVAEAISLCNTASHANSLHLENVILKSDNQILVETCRGNQRNREVKGMVDDINNLRASIQMSGITRTRREGNCVAHEIASLASKGLLTDNWTSNPPNTL